MKKQQLIKTIKNNTLAMDDVFADLTDEQKQAVDAEIKYYDILLTLKKVRQDLGLTQERLAQKAKIPRTTITKIESGSYNPTINTLMSLASAMDKKLRVDFV